MPQHEHGALSSAEQMRILRVTGLYARIAWLLYRLGARPQRFLCAHGVEVVALAGASRK
jgi:hypothetical protein